MHTSTVLPLTITYHPHSTIGNFDNTLYSDHTFLDTQEFILYFLAHVYLGLVAFIMIYIVGEKLITKCYFRLFKYRLFGLIMPVKKSETKLVYEKVKKVYSDVKTVDICKTVNKNTYKHTLLMYAKMLKSIINSRPIILYGEFKYTLDYAIVADIARQYDYKFYLNEAWSTNDDML